jgi:hypothetical protein
MQRLFTALSTLLYFTTGTQLLDLVFQRLLEKSESQASRQLSPQMQYTEGWFKSWWRAVIKQQEITTTKKMEKQRKCNARKQSSKEVGHLHMPGPCHLMDLALALNTMHSHLPKRLWNKSSRGQVPWRGDEDMIAMEEGGTDGNDYHREFYESDKNNNEHKEKQQLNDEEDENPDLELLTDDDMLNRKPPANFGGCSIPRESSS